MGGAPWKLFCQRPWDRLQPIINGASAYQDHLSPIHTGDCIVAEFGDKLSQFPAKSATGDYSRQCGQGFSDTL